MLITLAIFGIVAAVGMSVFTGTLGNMKFGASVRDVQSELQRARMKAVSANRPMRVRFNCPAPGQFRAVELIGTPASPDPQDTALNRCDTTLYPYPPKDVSVVTRPNHDGPLQRLRQDVKFAASPTIEFWPDGTAHADAGTGTPWPAIGAAGVNVALQYKTQGKTITVNGLGKTQIQ